MDSYVKLLQEGDYIVVALVLAISAVFNLSKIVDFYKSNRRQRRESITNAIADPDLTPELKDHFRDELNIEYFRCIHGVKLSLPMLKAALVLNERISEQVSFRHVVKSVKVMPNIDGIHLLSYRVKLSKFETTFCFYNLICGFFMVIYGVISILLFLYLIFTSFNPGLLASGIAVILMGAYMFNDGSTWVSVRHVNSALAEIEENS
ncbi:conserved membrane hypothetical protein [Vibrio nigripulchritudo SOn1]|uniref:DUF2721 domain-containing protein n=1 Tax=Vibrio nigripulchritudo SOn1 TaxID=1238450 RepID=A0AAV2VNY7_9VIBR|nr:hypothetical protein [Vibrio nigripulchritudo]CCO46387.1 conserved membrane hypothetical protein [Vibrio nigripulchritudo SOn1]